MLTDSTLSKDGIYSPGANILVAYIPTGYNYEDAADTCESEDVTRREDNFKTFKFQLLDFSRLQLGDKLSGRHSNKGVVSRIRENSKMPVFKNGVHVEMLFNPCGVPSRMNIGQMPEAAAGFAAHLLGIRISSNPFNGLSTAELKRLFRYVYELANSDDAECVNAEFNDLPTGLLQRGKERHSHIREWEGCFNPDCTATLWNPETGKYFESPVAFGCAYVLKLECVVSHKMHVRAGVPEEDYSQISKQPTQGASRGGGQRYGEMEMTELAAHGANAASDEVLNSASDNITAKNNEALWALYRSRKISDKPSVPESVNHLRYCLEALGVKITSDGGDE